MNQQKTLIRIGELLSRFSVEVSILNSNATFDINIVSEDVLVPVLNIAYKCKLKNAKYSEKDTKFPALDLLDKENRVAFQITSSSDLKKIKKTIEGIVKNRFYNHFDTFYIYIITQKNKSYDKTSIEKSTQSLFPFTIENIHDYKDLYQKIASLDYEDILKIEKLLENQFSDFEKDEKIIQDQLKDIISESKRKFNENYWITELEGAYKARQAWLEKKIFFENKLPLLSDINQQFQLLSEIEEINEQIAYYNNQISLLLTQRN